MRVTLTIAALLWATNAIADTKPYVPPTVAGFSTHQPYNVAPPETNALGIPIGSVWLDECHSKRIEFSSDERLYYSNGQGSNMPGTRYQVRDGMLHFEFGEVCDVEFTNDGYAMILSGDQCDIRGFGSGYSGEYQRWDIPEHD